jgi:type II secretory pathway pseudopilin PulG
MRPSQDRLLLVTDEVATGPVLNPKKDFIGLELMKKTPANATAQRGFTLIEAVIVFALTLILAALAVIGYQSILRYLRIAGDARSVNGLIAQAKMRAAADFTHARVYADLGANTYHLEVWNPNGNGGAGCWQTDNGGPGCTTATSPVQRLSTGVTFGFANVPAGAPNPQVAIAQAPLCDAALVNGVPNGTIANTSCIEFNSRGVPIALNGKPTANDALYVSDGTSVYGTTLLASGMMQDWSTTIVNPKWQVR